MGYINLLTDRLPSPAMNVGKVAAVGGNINPGDTMEYLEERPNPEADELHEILYEAQHWMQGVLEHGYNTGSRTSFEDALEELAGVLGLKLPDNELII